MTNHHTLRAAFLAGMGRFAQRQRKAIRPSAPDVQLERQLCAPSAGDPNIRGPRPRASASRMTNRSRETRRPRT